MKSARNTTAWLSIFGLALAQGLPLQAKGNGTTAGLTLLEAPSARASGLAESMAAVGNDVSAYAYNPAALSSLRSGQASFLYQKGLIDDSFGQLRVGWPAAHGGVGLSVGYYNGGDMQIADGATTRTVNAQRDISVSLGLAGHAGRWGYGAAGKYLSSEIVESARADGYAADVGLTFAATSRLRFGAAVQNLGPKLTYVSEGDDLPRSARIGMALSLPRHGVTTTLMTDAAYRMVERDFQPSLGIEFGLGPLALRSGVRLTGGQSEFTAGTGFLMGASSIDYSVGIARELDTTHRISYSFHFGSSGDAPPAPAFVRGPASAHPPEVVERLAQTPSEVQRLVPHAAPAPVSHGVYRIDQAGSIRRIARTYVIRSGDTLASVAREQYGDARLWQRIYSANKHLISDPRKVEVGQKIVLP